MEQPKITKAQQIKDILEPIPADMFITGEYGNKEGKSCALGFIHRKLSPKGEEDYRGDKDGYGARDLTSKFLKEVHELNSNIASVNNSSSINGYTEPITKDRVMHLVNDMIKAGY